MQVDQRATTTAGPHPSSLGLPSVAPSSVRADAGAASGEGRLRGVRFPLAVYAASRLLVLVPALVVAALNRSGDPGAGPWPSVGGTGVVRVLGRWDSAWYLDIAANGYPGRDDLAARLETVAFFPVLPALVRGTASLTGLSQPVAGVLLATLLGALAVVVVWRLVDHLAGRQAANRSAALLSVFPGAFVFSTTYAEPLLLAAAGGCLLALCRRNWVLAGVLGAVATASRPNGVVVVAACAVAAVEAVRRDGDRRALLAPAIAPVGIAGYFGFLWWHTGHVEAWFDSQREAWGDSIDFGRGTIGRTLGFIVDPHVGLQHIELNPLVGVLGLAFTVVALMALWRWRPPLPVSVYGVLAIGMALVSNHVGPRPRFILAAFPLVVAVAVMSTGRTYRVLLAGSATLLVALSVIQFTTVAATP